MPLYRGTRHAARVEAPVFATGLPDPFVIHSCGRNSLGPLMVACGQTCSSAVWPSANLAIFYPFFIVERHRYRVIFWHNGATAAGDVDAGIYSTAGAKLVSTGAVAQSGTSTSQQANIDVTLEPGMYYLALSSSSGAATFMRGSPTSNWGPRAAVVRQMAAAHPLPTTATFANISNSYVPMIGIAEATWL